MKFLYSVLLIVFLVTTAIGQHRCQMDEYSKQFESQKPQQTSISRVAEGDLNPVEGVVVIPIVFHVIHNISDGQIKGTNISDEQILSQLRILNEDFRRKPETKGYNTEETGADVEIEFCLATRDPEGNTHTGINRVFNSKPYWTLNEINNMKALSYWPSDKYLNVWVTNVFSTLGISQFPEIPGLPGLQPPYEAETDGVVINYKYFGSVGTAQTPYDYGRTLTHETGHFFGLLHLWGKSTCGDDYIQDTPWDEKGTKTGSCIDSSDCDGNGVFTRDMTNNYMDYTDDACMNIFTAGQKERMRSVLKLSARRNSLISSNGCNAVNGISSRVKESVRLFPNPANEIVNLEFQATGKCNLKVFNDLNILVREEKISESSNISINISDLHSGVYFIVLEFSEKKYFSKFVKL